MAVLGSCFLFEVVQKGYLSPSLMKAADDCRQDVRRKGYESSSYIRLSTEVHRSSEVRLEDR